MSLVVLQGGLENGLILAIMAIGMFLSFKVLNIPDLTVDGSFTLGTAVSAIFAVNGHPVVGILVAMAAGAVAGAVTGLLQTKLKVQPILAGILTMTALYSINLRVMGNKPNIPLMQKNSIFTPFAILPGFLQKLLPIFLILICITAIVWYFLRTQLGMSLRATGDNESMVRASSINSDGMKILGLSLSNAIVALAGAVMAQYLAFADVSSGIGMMVIGLASIIVGDAFFRKGGVTRGILAAIVGSVIYRLLLALVLQLGLSSNDVKLFSALLVIIAISIPVISGIVRKRRERNA